LGFGIRARHDSRHTNHDESRIPNPESQHLTRRKFLAAALLVPAVAQQSSTERFVATVPLGNPSGGPTAPLNRLLGSGLDARQFTDLSTINRRDPNTLVTPTDRFYIRTAAPKSPVTMIDLSALARFSVRAGPYVMECAGNADPANFGLLSAATWEGIPINAVLDRLRPPTPTARVLVSGVDDPGPSATSVPGASWIFARDQLDRALLATRMNDAPLVAHHGAPMRLVVPGWYGCACIKWIDRIEYVSDIAPPTTQMQEFAVRTHQPFDANAAASAIRARDFEAATIDTAAIPVRVDKWIVGGRLEYRITGIIWGGTKPTNALSIRFRIGEPWVKVDDCPLPASTLTWSTWTHAWRPKAAGRYDIVLRVDDRTIRTRRLDLFYYVRAVDIADV
jgi:DMSO/TMAO reductase YedYZ molybdopterin-dependent catalytic subunit